MFIQKYPLKNKGEGSSGAGGEDFKAKYEEMSAENERMRKHQQKLLDETKEVKKALKAFEGIDPTNIKDMMKKLDSSEEAKLLAEGKIDEVVSQRTERMRVDYEQKLQEATTVIEQSKSDYEKLTRNYNQEKIASSLRKSAELSKARPEAIDDILRRGMDVFTIGENGDIEARNNEGELVLAKNRKALTPDLFVDDLKAVAGYMWPDSEGHGGSGKRGSKNIVNPFKKGTAGYNITEQAKLRKSDPGLADQLAKEALQG